MRVWAYLLPFWYPIVSRRDLVKIDGSLHKIVIDGDPFVVYKKTRTPEYVVHSDVCPHQGASFAATGWLNKQDNLHCGYHGFEFCDGRFCRIPDPARSPPAFRSRIALPVYPTTLMSDFLYFQPAGEAEAPVFFPVEEFDADFVSIEGSCEMDKDHLWVCENLLDMMHISYVHSFGNKKQPLPQKIRTQRLGEHGFRARFEYHPASDTISTRVGGAGVVVVENEYHLPTNTITRVFAGDIVKTVFTRTIPVSSKKSVLWWKIYRNFWIDPYFPVFTGIGSALTRFLMERTLREDRWILSNTYDGAREGPLRSRYDTTIDSFRADMKKYAEKKNNILSSQKKNEQYDPPVDHSHQRDLLCDPDNLHL
jgi:phenylpropionate dioxygenase-like ring-hydroxylating dioxygenase large terminal subunit